MIDDHQHWPAVDERVTRTVNRYSVNRYSEGGLFVAYEGHKYYAPSPSVFGLDESVYVAPRRYSYGFHGLRVESERGNRRETWHR